MEKKITFMLRSSGIKIASITEMAKGFSTSKRGILVIIEVRTRDTIAFACRRLSL
jgi:hypothetical protein